MAATMPRHTAALAGAAAGVEQKVSECRVSEERVSE
jgi:hypothetical protein